MDLKEQFEEAIANSKQLPDQNNDNLLKLYSLYKQATEGDVAMGKPTNMFDFKGIAKFNAWEALKGISSEEAMKTYISFVNSLK